MAVARAEGRLRGKQPKLTPRQRRTSSSLTALVSTPSASPQESSRGHPLDHLPCRRARARAGERWAGQHRAQRDDRSRRTYHARRLPRLDDRQHGRRDQHLHSRTKASRPTLTAATKTAACVARRRSPTSMRSTGPTRDRLVDFSGSPNGWSISPGRRRSCSTAGSRSP